MLTALSIRFSVWRNSHRDHGETPLDGTGFLHAIWLYRNDPALEMRLLQVDHPTNENLREAGMVEARLVSEKPSQATWEDC
jgi:hypothetical protein